MSTDIGSARYARARRIGGYTRLAANELPHDPSAAVRAAIRSEPVHRYPDPDNTALTSALARHLRVSAEHIMLGGGSSSVLQRLIHVVCAQTGDAVMWTAPGFDAVGLFAEQAGASAQQVAPAENGAVDLEAMLAAITPKTRLIVLVNPHNPTGAVSRGDDLRAFLTRLDDKKVTVVLDEAYAEFCTDPQVVDGVELAKSRWAAGHHNLVVVRTFSKAFGLAGLRVGYGIAAKSLARRVRDAGVPREVSRAAQIAATTALHELPAMRQNVTRIVAERKRLREQLRNIGYSPTDSHANFLWLPLAEDAGRFAQHCADDGVEVLALGTDGVRVSIGNPADNDTFLRSAHTWIAARAAIAHEHSSDTPGDIA